MTSGARSFLGVSGSSESEWSPREDQRLRPEELSLLLTVMDTCSSAGNVAEILASLYVELQPILPFERLEYAVVDETGFGVTTQWHQSAYEAEYIRVGFEYTRAESVASSPQYRVTSVNNDMPAYARERPPNHPVGLLVREGMKSSLSCPLVVDDEVRGFLFFNTVRYDGYTDHHASLIQIIAGQIAAIIAQVRLNEELTARNEKLQEMEQSRLEFIASISHELRTPLTAVVGFASEIQDRVDAFSPEELRQFAGVIAAQSNEVSGIVEDLLVITRAEAGYLTVTPAPVNIAAELKHVRGALPEERPNQKITLGLSDVVAWADPLRVRQIARNLLSNAARYGGDDVRMRVSTAGFEVVIVVSDDGPGIPEGEEDEVFKAYGRSHLSASKPGSIGLGLTVSRYLAEAMEGSLEYQRVDGISRFDLTLPLYRPGRSRYERPT
ncbi:MAG: HAMP domain-containing histidine kinase [bacterium]|nr:HAMP domain-containing histidine kinase [bacterium]